MLQSIFASLIVPSVVLIFAEISWCFRTHLWTSINMLCKQWLLCCSLLSVYISFMFFLCVRVFGVYRVFRSLNFHLSYPMKSWHHPHKHDVQLQKPPWYNLRYNAHSAVIVFASITLPFGIDDYYSSTNFLEDPPFFILLLWLYYFTKEV